MKSLRAIYRGEEYTIIHKYQSGYCEIQRYAYTKIELVHKSELTFLSCPAKLKC